MSKFLTFRKFYSSEEAIAMSELLKENNIPVELEETPVMLDPLLIGQQFDRTFLLKIPQDQFVAADNFLRSAVSVQEGDVEEDYYLLAFSDKELQEVIEKKDEWGNYDYTLALHLLEKRGITYTPAQLESISQQRNQQLIAPEKDSIAWVVVGYLSALTGGFPGALIGGLCLFLLGFFIGGFLWQKKKTLPDGNRVFAYSRKIRLHGKIILIINCIMMPMWMWHILSMGHSFVMLDIISVFDYLMF